MTEIIGFLASVISITAFVYTIMRNFKNDINARIDKLEQRMDRLDERMFLLSTGKTLAQAILEEKIKENRS